MTFISQTPIFPPFSFYSSHTHWPCWAVSQPLSWSWLHPSFSCHPTLQTSSAPSSRKPSPPPRHDRTLLLSHSHFSLFCAQLSCGGRATLLTTTPRALAPKRVKDERKERERKGQTSGQKERRQTLPGASQPEPRPCSPRSSLSPTPQSEPTAGTWKPWAVTFCRVCWWWQGSGRGVAGNRLCLPRPPSCPAVSGPFYTEPPAQPPMQLPRS